MQTIHDLIGIGIGPFNLGLAALCQDIPSLNCLFVDQQPSFNWHPGLLLEGARMQVPFYADLVTLADPCSPFSFLAFLKAKGRMFRFASAENYFPLRKEYNDYCRWVVSKLSSLRFGYRCKTIRYSKRENCYEVITDQDTFLTKHIVIGIGTVPYIPPCAKGLHHPFVFHASDYLYRRKTLLEQKSITIIGSGQSAAEIFHDLQQACQGECYWFTRSPRFFPMEYAALTLEMTSPEYIDHFYSLSPEKKRQVLSSQNPLYKGINSSLINGIYDELYRSSIEGREQSFHLQANTELKSIMADSSSFRLSLEHLHLQRSFEHTTQTAILATGYRYPVPDFIQPVKEHIQWMKDVYRVNRNYSIDQNGSIFVQNAELHTHGFNAPDLGMGPYRNAVILNTILGYEHFQMETETTFQTFCIPR